MKSSSLKSNILKTLETIRRNKGNADSIKKVLGTTVDKGVFYGNQLLKYSLYKIKHPEEFQRSKNSVYVIYTMGKVGSTTLYSTLWEKIPHENLYHVHFLSEAGMRKREEFHNDPNVTAEDRKIIEYINQHPDKKLKIITLVREPLSRDISDLFQCLHIYFPDKEVSQITDHDLRSKLEINNYQHTLHWFDEEFKEYLKFDIYETSFDKKKGYQIYKNENLEVLLIRVEDLSRCYREALYEFTGVYFDELINTNLTDDKESAELNKRFKKNIRIEKEQLEKLYASKYVRHFYTDEEIASFIKKYSA